MQNGRCRLPAQHRLRNFKIKVPVAGGTPTTLLIGLNKPTGVAVDSGGIGGSCSRPEGKRASFAASEVEKTITATRV
jgi:hypothetical protein